MMMMWSQERCDGKNDSDDDDNEDALNGSDDEISDMDDDEN